MAEGGVEPGWYADPAGKYESRWFDGQAWTDQVSERGIVATDPFFDAGVSVAAPPEASGLATPQARRRGRRRRVVVAGALLLVVAAVVAALVTAGGDDDEQEIVADEGAATTTSTEAPTTTSTTEATTTTTEPVDPADVIGASLATALTDLRRAGFSDIVQQEVIDESVADGQVVGAEEQSDGSVVLTVARAPVTRFLEEIRAVEGDVAGPPFRVSGATYTHGVTGHGCRTSRFFEYDLGRDYRRLQAVAGILDDEPSVTRMRMEISLDGAIVSTTDLAFGETVTIDLDVTDMLRLRVVLSALETASSYNCPSIGFGDGRLLGVPSEVPPPAG